MNSAEQKNFEHETPTSEEVLETIRLVQEALNHNQNRDPALDQGYSEVARLLSNNENSYEKISENLTYDQAKLLAVLAVDYLNGEKGRDELIQFIA